MVAVDSCKVCPVAAVTFSVIQAAFGQGQEGPSRTPPRVPAGRRSSKEVPAGITTTFLTALTLTVGVGVKLLVRQAAAECTRIGEVPVSVGGIQNLTVLKLRGGGARERTAAPGAVLVGL